MLGSLSEWGWAVPEHCKPWQLDKHAMNLPCHERPGEVTWLSPSRPWWQKGFGCLAEQALRCLLTVTHRVTKIASNAARRCLLQLLETQMVGSLSRGPCMWTKSKPQTLM